MKEKAYKSPSKQNNNNKKRNEKRERKVKKIRGQIYIKCMANDQI